MQSTKVKKPPQRMCIVCKTMRPKAELIRIVRTPEGIMQFDRSGKLNGRGAYICDNAECVEKCLKKKMLNKAFKTNIEEEIYTMLSEEYADGKD